MRCQALPRALRIKPLPPGAEIRLSFLERISRGEREAVTRGAVLWTDAGKGWDWRI